MAKAKTKTKTPDKKVRRAEIFKKFTECHSAKDSFSNVKEWIKTGNKVWDASMGGGVPVGRVIEFSGFNGTGKSECLQIIGDAFIKAGGSCLIQDVEIAYSSDWLAKKGIDIEEMVISNPSHLQESLEEIENVLDNADKVPQPLMIGVDSVAVLGVQGKVEDVTKKDYPREASAWQKWFKSCGVAKKLMQKRTSLVCTNQSRKPMDGGLFMSVTDYVTAAGEAMKYMSSIRQYLRIGKAIKASIKGQVKKIGYEIVVTNIKSRTDGKPFLEFIMPFYYGVGWDNEQTISAFMIKHKIAESSGKIGSSTAYQIPKIEEKFTEKTLTQKLKEDMKFQDHCMKLIEEIM